MPPNTTSEPRDPLAEDRRLTRLRVTVRAAAWWLLLQGGLDAALGNDMAVRLGLRYEQSQLPYLRTLALALLCLGFFLLKALRDPRRQYLAVDVLILFFLGQTYGFLDFRLRYGALTRWEWLAGALDLGLGASLALHRTRSGQMEGGGSLVSGKALDLARQTGRWVAGDGPAPKPTLGDLEPPADGDKKGKGTSEAIPHMD